MISRAYAKINLNLDVKSRLENGFHELEMVMVPITFFDTIEINIANEMKLESNRGYIPIDDKNTIIKAINLLRAKYGFKENFDIKVTKHVPTQAGLAGGSSDGATAIKMVDSLLHLNMTKDEMKEIAKQVGSDVTFFIENAPCKVQGVGDILTPFKINCPFHILLVKPRRGVSTKKAFDMLDINNLVHPDIDGMIKALENNDYNSVLKCLGNSLEEVSMELVPEIKYVKKRLYELGMDGVLMSGSGSTVFGLTRNINILKSVNDTMKNEGYFVRKCQIYGGNR